MFKFKTLRQAVTAMFVLNGALFGAWASRIPSVQQEFNLSESDLGVLLLLMAAGAICSFPFAGRLADRFGAAKMTLFFTLFYCPALIIIGYSNSVIMLGVALFFFGISHGSMDVTMNGWGAEVEKSLKKPIMSNLHAMFSVGAGLGAAFGVLSTWLALNYTLHFLLFAAILSPIIYSAYLPHYHSTPIITKQVKQRFKISMPSGLILALGLVAFANAIGEGAVTDWSAVYLTNTLSATASEGAIGYTIFSIFMVLMRFGGDYLITRFGARLIVQFSGIMSLLGSFIVIFASQAFTAYIGFAFMGIGYAIVMPLVFSNAANSQNGKSGAAIANIAMFSYGGLLLGPPIIGFIAQTTSLRTAFIIFTILAIIVIIGAKSFKKKPT